MKLRLSHRLGVRRILAKVADHPRTGVAIGLIGVLATFGTYFLTESGSKAPSGPPASSSKQASPDGQSSRVPSPLLGSNASCREFRQTAAPPRGGRLLVDSPGRIGGGPGLRARLLPGGRFLELLDAPARSEVEISAQLHNSAYTAAEVSSVTVPISTHPQRCWRIVAAVTVRTFPEDHPQVGPALILLKSAGSAILHYVQGSTSLLDENGHTLAANLADGVTKRGISLPFAVPGGTAYYLNFRVRIKASRSRPQSRPDAADRKSRSISTQIASFN